MSKFDFWNKRRKREQTGEPLPWQQQHQPPFDPYQDTTRSSVFLGDDDWDMNASRPMFATHPDGRSRSYEDFLRARSQSRPWDNPYGGSHRRFGYSDEEEEVPGIPLRRAMQIGGSIALVGVLYLTFQSDSPMAQKVTAFVQQSMTEDTNLTAVSSWWKENVTDKVAVPASTTPVQTTKPVEQFVLPVQGTVKTAYDGKEQQGVTMKAALGAEIKAAGGGMIEKVEEDAANDFSVTINHGSSGRTIYSHLATVNVKQNQWVDATALLGTLTTKGDSAELFFVFEKDGTFLDPAGILDLSTGR